MIRIHRPAGAPEILRTKGLEARRALEAQLAGHAPPPDAATPVGGGTEPEAHVHDGSTPFSREIYAHASVKTALVHMQHEKCAFCEAKPLHVSNGDVEHFRPKAAVRQADAEPLVRPGYYWLAYEWTNLLFACERCNRRHKKNLFPLQDAARRARTPRAELTEEAPLFIDPSAEDPALYIGFRDHVPYAIGGNPRGESTIEALGLRRPELMADRERHLAQFGVLRALMDEEFSALEKLDHLRSRASALLDRQTRPDAEYAAMVRALDEKRA